MDRSVKYGKNKALAPFGTGASYGSNANDFLGWMSYGASSDML